MNVQGQFVSNIAHNCVNLILILSILYKELLVCAVPTSDYGYSPFGQAPRFAHFSEQSYQLFETHIENGCFEQYVPNAQRLLDMSGAPEQQYWTWEKDAFDLLLLKRLEQGSQPQPAVSNQGYGNIDPAESTNEHRPQSLISFLLDDVIYESFNMALSHEQRNATQRTLRQICTKTMKPSKANKTDNSVHVKLMTGSLVTERSNFEDIIIEHVILEDNHLNATNTLFRKIPVFDDDEDELVHTLLS